MQPEDMKVLVTGGAGFLGKYVCKELEKQGIEYYGWTSFQDGSLCDRYNTRDFFEDWENRNFTHVIHLAARVGGIGANSAKPFDFIHDNLLMGLNLIDEVVEQNRHRYDNQIRIVMASTVCAYPEFTQVPFKEDDLWSGRPEPTNSGYGIAKRTLMEVLDCAREQHGLKSVVCNIANLYGIGDSTDLQSNHVVPAIFGKCKEILNWKKSWGEERWPYLNLWGTGKATRDLLWAADAAVGLVKCLNLDDGSIGGINLGSGVETSIHQLAFFITELMGIPFEQVLWNGNKPNGQLRRCLNIDRAVRMLDWKPKVKLYDGLKELAQYYKDLS